MSKYVIKYGDNAHLALMFAKVNDGVVTVPYLGFMNDKKFPRSMAGNTTQMLKALTRYGLFTYDGMGWSLTTTGREAIRQVTRHTLRLGEVARV
jgi:hypothetical protein